MTTFFTPDLEDEAPRLPDDLDQSALTLEQKRYNPRHRFYSNMTQVIANNLPDWSKIRRVRQSNGQELLNSMYGMWLKDLSETEDLNMRRKFLLVAPLDEADIVTEAVIPSSISLDEPAGISNILRNSYFQIRSYGHDLPDRWLGTATKAIVTTGLEGHNALQLSVASSSTAEVYQDLVLRIRAGEKWTGSVFYKIPTNALTKPTSGFGLQLIGTLSNNTTETLQSVFEPTTDGEWARLTVTGSFTRETRKLRFKIVIKDEGGFLFSGNTVDIDCCQLEVGSQASPWRAREDDRYPYMQRDTLAAIHVTGSDSAILVDNDRDFWPHSFPTRAQHSGSLAETAPAVTLAGRFPNTDWQDKTQFFGFEIQSPRLMYRDIDFSDDVLADFYLAFRNQDGFYKIKSTGVTLETLTSFGEYLWVIGTMPGLDGVTARYLMVVDPKFTWPATSPQYLEVISSVQLTDDVPIGEAITSCEFRQEDRQHLYVYTASDLYVQRLRYDIYTLDTATGRVLLRENPTSLVLI